MWMIPGAVQLWIQPRWHGMVLLATIALVIRIQRQQRSLLLLLLLDVAGGCGRIVTPQ